MKKKENSSFIFFKEKSLFFLLIFLMIVVRGNPSKIFAQIQENGFNRFSTAHSETELEKSFLQADSLFQNAANSVEKINALLAQAKIRYRQKKIKDAFHFAWQAEAMASKTKNIEGQIHCKAFYSVVYRDLFFNKESLEELDKIEKLLKQISSVNKRNQLFLLNSQARAQLFFAEEDYDKVLYYLKEGEKVYDHLQSFPDGEYLLAISAELKARTYFLRKDYENSYTAYQVALNSLENYTNDFDPVYGFVYAGLGSIAHLQQADSATAQQYFEKANILLNEIKDSDMQFFVAQKLRKYYADQNEIDRFQHFTKIRDSVRNRMNYERKILVADFYADAKSAVAQNKSKMKIFPWIIVLLGFALIGLLIGYLKKSKPAETLPPISKSENQENESKEQSGVGLGIAEETEELILAKLADFEKAQIFLDGNINLAAVAIFCESNSRYVSEVIKKYKETDFHGYINRLRIEYIEEKLQNDERYLSYKISYLAEEAGFSSHSKFSALFKEEKGVTPSVFIKRIRKKQIL